jgi:hypothetical protein
MASERKAYFAVEDRIKSESWSNDVLAFAIRLLALMHERWRTDKKTAEEACAVIISAGTLMDLAGCRSIVRAKRTARQLADNSSTTLEELGEYYRVEWRKFAEIQGLKSKSGPKITLSETETETEDEKGKNKTAARAARPAKPAGVIAPWAIDLSEYMIERLRGVKGARIPRNARTSWAKEIERMPSEIPSLTANGTPPEVMLRKALDFALGPENLGQPFEVVIRSGGSFRAKFSQLVEAKARRRREAQPIEESAGYREAYERAIRGSGKVQ